MPATPALPAQVTGTRPSRALPYELHTTSRTDAGAKTVTLMFSNTGTAGAVFHVYDKLHLDAIPRRYVVEAGKSLDGLWNVAADNGKYDLWVLGPNGYHREYVGDLNEQSAGGGTEIQVCYAPCDPPVLQVKLYNRSDKACTFSATARAYRTDGPWGQKVEAGKVGELTWTLGDSGNWYDFEISCDLAPSLRRRIAGRIETGKDTVSDPAMGQLS
ncbi:Non-hemolytic phospholipase C precursor [compost metagenome]